MRTAFPNHGGKFVEVLLQHSDRYIAQGADCGIPLLKTPDSFFALVAASVVGTRRVIVLGHGVADYKRNAGGDGNKLIFEGAAIEEESVPCFSEAGDELVHDSDAGADKTVLSLTAELGNLGQRQLRLAQAHQSKRGGDFESRGGAQSRGNGNLAVYKQVRALKLMPPLPKGRVLGVVILGGFRSPTGV